MGAHIDRSSSSKVTVRRAAAGTVRLAPTTGPRGPEGPPSTVPGPPGGSDEAFAAWVSDADSQTRAALASQFARVFTPEAYGAVGNGATDDTAALTAMIAAVRAAGGGRVLLGPKAYKVSSQIDVTGFTKPGGDTWQDRGIVIEGHGVLSTRIVSTHGGTVFRFHTGKMFSALRNLEIVGPGKATASSRAVYWDGPDGNALFENLYVHGYAVGMEWRDATLHTMVNVAVRECATGIRTGFNHDLHTYMGCRFDYNDTAIQIGQADSVDGGHAERDNFSQPIRFLNCRISNNTVRAAFISDRYANVHFDACYFESNPREADIGVSGRVDGVGPTVTYTDSFFTPVTTAPVAVGIEVWNRAHITLERSSTDGDGRYVIFCRLNDENEANFRAVRSRIRATTAAVQYGGRNFNDTGEKRETFEIGRAGIDHMQGAYLPATNIWHDHQMPGGTGKTWDRWTRNSSADNSVLAAASVRDIGGVMRVAGEDDKAAFIAATSYSALPTAGVNYRGCLGMVRGNGTTTADTLYVCLMSATGTYSWKSIVAG